MIVYVIVSKGNNTYFGVYRSSFEASETAKRLNGLVIKARV